MQTIKFRTFENGSDVTLKLRVGETLRHVSGGRTEEGYSYREEQWSFDGQTVRYEWSLDARDCDGRISDAGESEWNGCELNNYGYPDWQHVDSSHRDYSAEAANY
jgi:hypothetical protein